MEGAVLIPVLFLLMYGVYEFSWFFYQQQLVSTGVRDAARYLARSSVDCGIPSPEWTAQEARAKALAITGAVIGGAPRVPGWRAAMVAVTCTAIANPIGTSGLRAYRGGPFIHLVTVSTRFAAPTLGFFRLVRIDAPAVTRPMIPVQEHGGHRGQQPFGDLLLIGLPSLRLQTAESGTAGAQHVHRVRLRRQPFQNSP